MVRTGSETGSHEEDDLRLIGSSPRLAALGLAAGLWARGSGLMIARKIRSRSRPIEEKSLDLRFGGKTC